MSKPAPILSFHDLASGYDQHPVIQNINGAVKQGALISIMGPNGGGKSTLLKAIAGLLPPISGAITFHGAPKPKLAYLPQASSIDKTFPISVLETAAMGLWHETGPLFAITKELRTKTMAALSLVKMANFAAKRIGDLSGGQLQRVLFARTYLENADIIMLDEPFSCVDQETTNDLMGHILEWHKAGKTILIVNHNLELTKKYFPETLFLMKTILYWGNTKDTLEQLGALSLAASTGTIHV